MSFFKRLFKTAVKIGLAYATGGTSAAIMAGASSVAGGSLSSPKKQSSPVTGMVSGQTQAAAPAMDPAAEAAKQDQQKRLALNAGAGTDTAQTLGSSGKATVTKKRLLGA